MRPSVIASEARTSALGESEAVAEAIPEEAAVGSPWWREPTAWCAVLLLALVLVSAARANPSSASDPVFTSPRQSVTWSLAEAWADTGRPAIEDSRLTELPDDVGVSLTPRDGASIGDEIVPKDFPLTVALYAVGHLAGNRAALLITPFQAVFLMVAVGATSRALFRNSAAGLVAMLLLLCSYSFWQLAGSNVVADPVGTGALLLGMALLLERPQRWWIGPLAGIFFAVSVAARYTAIGPVLVAIALAVVFRVVRIRSTVGIGAGLLLGLLPVLWYHRWLYGGVTETGYSAGDALFSERLRFEEARGLLSFDASRFFSHVQIYLLKPASLLILGVAVWGAWSLRHRPEGRWVASVTAVTMMALVTYHGGQGTWGVDRFVVNASFLRYLLPVFALLCVLASGPLSRLRANQLTAALVIGGLVANSVMSTAWSGRGGFEATAAQVLSQQEERDQIIELTPSDAIIVTRLGSKVVFPARAASTATFLRTGERLIADRSILVWEILPSVEQLAESLESFTAGSDPIYLFNDGGDPWVGDDDMVELRRLLAARGLGIEPVGPEEARLFSIVAA